MTRLLCPVCAKDVPDPSFIDPDSEFSSAGNVVWSKVLCEECQERKSKGFILIGAVEEKTQDATAPYRSGNIWVVTQEVAEEVFKPHGAPASGIAFIDVKVADAMELPGVNLNA